MKELLLSRLYHPPLRGLARRVRPRAAILVYHRVAAPVDDPYGQAVPPETFAAHLDLLTRAYRVLPLSELVDALPRRRYLDRSVAVTFDDGYADNLTAAWPLAAERGVPITVFAAAGPVLDGDGFWWDELAARVPEPAARGRHHQRLKSLPCEERRRALGKLGTASASEAAGRPLTPGELRDLAGRPGVEIGAHTLSHPALAALPAEEQRQEIVQSRERLEALLGRPVRFLAYPFGKPKDVSAETIGLARAAGFRAAFTTVPQRIVPSTPRFALPRLTIHAVPAAALARQLDQILGEPGSFKP